MSGPFFTMDELLGGAERNWAHLIHKHTNETRCGFKPNDGADISLRNPFAPLADCPDCHRAKSEPKPKPSRVPDAHVRRAGGIAIVYPTTAQSEAWLRASTDGLWHEGGLVVEMPYLGVLVRAMMDAGFAYIKFEEG